MGYRGGERIAEVVRSGFVEGYHHGSVVVITPDTKIYEVGDVEGPIFPRSSNKPMQALAMLRNGLGLAASADLAMVAASHSGEPFHIERIRALLASGGLTENDLRCPPDLPLSDTARAAHLRGGGTASRILMNCSGKHTGMLLTCVARDWPLASYLDPEHPLQVACRQTIAELTGEPVSAIGVDGCGAPVMAVSLRGLATAFLRLVSASPHTPERRIADAMRAYPEIMSGTDADDARLMRAVPGLLAKGGAEGVWVAAVPDVGAVALKIDDGAGRARRPVMVEALRRLGVEGLDDLGDVPVLGGGLPVGRIAVVASGRS
jgi:L-asparaginase II